MTLLYCQDEFMHKCHCFCIIRSLACSSIKENYRVVLLMISVYMQASWCKWGVRVYTRLSRCLLHLHSARQVLIPDIVMAALQSGYSLLNGKESSQHIYTELQV